MERNDLSNEADERSGWRKAAKPVIYRGGKGKERRENLKWKGKGVVVGGFLSREAGVGG